MSDNGKRPLDRIDDGILEKVSEANEEERKAREKARQRYQRVTNDDYAEFKEKLDKQSASQEWREWRVSRKLTRKTRRHLANCDSLKKLANCQECPSRKECKQPCPMLEVYLQTAGYPTEAVATDKIITEAEWRPDNPKRPVDPDKRDEFFLDFASKRPSLGEVISGSKGEIDPEMMATLLDEDIITTLIDGKLPIEQIAGENYVALEYVQDLQGKVLASLGCLKPVLTEDQKILRAIILDRLTSNDAARIFNKQPQDISRRKRRAREKLAGILLPPAPE